MTSAMVALKLSASIFVKFETKYIEQCLDFLRTNLVGRESVKGKLIKVTGGGAFKYADLIQEKLGLA